MTWDEDDVVKKALLVRSGVGGPMGFMHIVRDRPLGGYCLLDFLDRWIWDAVHRHQDPEEAYKYARQMTHIALQVHTHLSYRPPHVVLGEN